MIRENDRYYLNKEEPAKSCLLALRRIILEQDANVSETQKYRMPCFTFHKKAFCYLWTDKKTEEPYILMVEGKALKHPELQEGSRSRMKILPVDSNKDLPIKTIQLVLEEALNLYKKGRVNI